MILDLPADDPDQFVLENSENLEEQLAHLTKELEANSKDDKKVSTLLVQRAKVFEKMQRIDQARSDIQTALLKDADNQDARQIFQRLLTTDSSVPAIEKSAEKKSTNLRAAQFQSYFQQVSSGNIPEIKKFVRSSGFVDVLAACGEQEADTESKSIAFMILTKIFNPPPSTEGYPMQTIIETCAQCFSKCIDSGKNAEKLLAYRTLGAILETGMTVGASILSQEGVVEEMMDVIDFEILPVQIAMTDVLATAASDKTCQKLIEKHASKWLAQTAKRSKDERLKASAGTALTKLQVQQRYQDNNIISSATNDNAEDALQNAMRQVDLGSTDLTDALMKTIKSYKNHDSSVVLNAVEGLAYSTLQPDVKESVASDPVLLKSLATLATDATNTNSNPLLFGVGTILSNTTMYKPVLDEQQKQMKRLRDLANAKSEGKPQEEEKEDEREKDEAVDRRVKAIVEQGISPVLLILAKNSSSNLKTVAAQTYFNLVTPQASRGKLLQQGVTKGLLPLALAKDSTYSPIAAQALAKLAITADPRIAFGSQTSLELVPPFLELCKDTAQLRQFEGLMALTNLASVDDNVRFRIYSDKGMPIFENLQLSNNDMVQRAATEMICNMTFCQPVFENYSRSPNRLRLLLILSDHEDVATRKAASGALAILANSKDTCERLANVDKAYERMVRLLDANEPADVQHRGIEIVRLMIENLGKEAAQAFAKEHANDMLVLIVTQSNVNVVRSAAMEVLKIFVKHGVPVKN